MTNVVAVITVIACLSVSSVFSSKWRGQINILLAPSSYLFLGNEPLRLSNLESAISLFMGKRFEPNDWSGLSLKDPFDFSQSVVILHIPGVSVFQTDGRSYPLIFDESVQTILYRAMDGDETKVVYLEDRQTARRTYRVKLRSNRGMPPPEFFGSAMNSYELFLEQLELLGKIGSKLSADERRGQVHWIGFTGYRLMKRMHPSDRNPAVNQLKDMITNVTKSLASNKNIRYLFAVVSYPSDDSVRKKREDEPAPSSETPPTTSNATGKATNQTDSGGAFGPPMFNLVFWSFFMWFIVLYGICIGFWQMNPGSHHTFYRLSDMKTKLE